MQIFYQHKIYLLGKRESGFFKNAGRSAKLLLLIATILSNATICIVFVPYFITNSLPMFVGFIWLLGPLLIVLPLAYASFITVLVSIISKCGMCGDGSCPRFFGTHCAVGLQVFGCLVLSMAYNYSQYCYFGGGYLTAIVYEFRSRDTIAWGQSFSNSTDFQIRNILAFF